MLKYHLKKENFLLPFTPTVQFKQGKVMKS